MVRINKKWMNEFAYKVARCPRCKQMSFSLIFSSTVTGDVWECANDDCGYNPSCGCGNCEE